MIKLPITYESLPIVFPAITALRLFFSLYLVLAFFVAPGLAGDLVVLHGVRGPDGWTRGVTASLRLPGDPELRVTELFLGPAWLGDDFFEDCYERFQPDWGAKRPDAVIADGESAFAFVRKYREDLFGGAPVVSLGRTPPDPAFGGLYASAGVVSGPDVQGTVDLGFRLRPDTAMVVGVMDGSPESQRLKDLVEAAMAPYLDRAQVVFPGHEPGDDQGLTLDGVASVASSVPRAGAVLFLGFERDVTGAEADQAAVVRTLVERSAGPVYVLADRWPGSGVLGGVVPVGDDSGRAASLQAGRLIRDPAHPPADVNVPARVVADLTVLARFGIPAKRLPSDALGRNPAPLPEGSAGITPTGALLAFAILALGAWLLIRVLRAE